MYHAADFNDRVLKDKIEAYNKFGRFGQRHFLSHEMHFMHSFITEQNCPFRFAGQHRPHYKVTIMFGISGGFVRFKETSYHRMPMHLKDTPFCYAFILPTTMTRFLALTFSVAFRTTLLNSLCLLNGFPAASAPFWLSPLLFAASKSILTWGLLIIIWVPPLFSTNILRVSIPWKRYFTRLSINLFRNLWHEGKLSESESGYPVPNTNANTRNTNANTHMHAFIHNAISLHCLQCYLYLPSFSFQVYLFSSSYHNRTLGTHSSLNSQHDATFWKQSMQGGSGAETESYGDRFY